MNTFKLDKPLARALSWIQKAQSRKMGRENLEGIHVDGDCAIAVDGYRVHAVRDLALPAEIKGQTTDFGKVPAGGGIVELTPVEGTFPAIDQVMPLGDPVFSIAVDPKLLREALDMTPGGGGELVILHFYGPHSPFEIVGKMDAGLDDLSCYALVMPMIGYEEKMYGECWRPYGKTRGYKNPPTGQNKDEE